MSTSDLADSLPASRQTSGEAGAEQEIKHEQAVVDRIYARLEAAADSARALAAEGHSRAMLGHDGGLVERDAIVYQAGRRLAALDAAHEGLVFGRLDMRDGEDRYIGRLGLRDADREVLLVDWRAPAAAVFYQTTAEEPQGVVRRRVIHSRGERVVDVEDDLLDADHAPDDLVVIGEGALLAALRRSRDHTMHSVVATIQREQDVAIRAPQRGVTTIVGGPGTGKTVVALHRAAYLLYTDRRRYESGGVLVVGPNPVFMAYIERVLPSLGETSVTLRAIGHVVDGVRATRHDIAPVAVLKGSMRMRTLLARTVRGPVPGAPVQFRMFYRDDVLVLDGPALRRLRAELLASGQRRNRVVPKVADLLIDALWEQASGQRAQERGKHEFASVLRGDRAFGEFVRSWWPVLDAVDVLGWLADRDLVAREAGGLLRPEEVDELAESLAADDFSVEDVPLLDELRYLLGEPPEPDPEADPLEDLYDDEVPELSTIDQRWDGRGRTVGSIEDDGYAHVLVDEAQDLSPMQWRMLGRRGRYSTWTVVGDPAQTSWPLADEAASARAEALRDKDERVFRLTMNYRNSEEIFALAAEYAGRRLPDADLPTAVRATGVSPRREQVAAGSLAVEVARLVDEVTAEVEGAVGVVVPAGWAARVGGWLTTRRPDTPCPGKWGPSGAQTPDKRCLDEAAKPRGEPDRVDDGHGGRVRVLEPLDSKGLEFDATVVVEPDLIADGSTVGDRTLYVVLTRATERLVLVGTTERWLR